MEKKKIIDAEGIHYRILNKMIHSAIKGGAKKIELENVFGQRFIADGLNNKNLTIEITGVAGADLAAFMDGAKISVNGNVQDACGNTMNEGEIVVFGEAGDILGHSMRGGRIFVRGSVGYRVGIHMKSYGEKKPVIVAGGKAGSFLGEYMAGGIIIILGLGIKGDIVGDFVGTGMHGGEIFIRGEIRNKVIGKEVKIVSPTGEDLEKIKPHISDFCRHFKISEREIYEPGFIKLYPATSRPYGNIYAY